jgi:hypothetical protein
MVAPETPGLADLLSSLTPDWLAKALPRGATIWVAVPPNVALHPEEVPVLRVLLDGLVGDALDALAGSGGSVVVRASIPSPEVLRLSVRHLRPRGQASDSRLRSTVRTLLGRHAAFDLLREVAGARRGKLRRQRGDRGEVVFVRLSRVADGRPSGGEAVRSGVRGGSWHSSMRQP